MEKKSGKKMGLGKNAELGTGKGDILRGEEYASR